jgi:pimeloyl-ACP methyl ester carboxylesterase
MVPVRELQPGGAYAAINGLQVYFEVHGTGRPLVVLHGGLLTIELAFGPMLPVLSQHHQVIGMDMQGHGRTADTDRPMRLEYLVDDVATLLEHLDISRADIFGFSLGGVVALELALRRPDVVGHLIIASVDHRPGHDEANQPSTPETAKRVPTTADFRSMRDTYARIAPDPGHFEAFATKAHAMVNSLQGWTDEELRSISAPTLLIVGDTDFVPVSRAATMHGLIPGAQLAVLPDTTHMGVIQSPDQVLPLVQRFLGSAASAG